MSVRHPQQPCSTCPYRMDSPRKLWHKSEFERLLESEADTLGSSVYACHKQARLHAKTRGVCAGWLLDQKRRNIPSIKLRIALAMDESLVQALDKVHSGGLKLFGTFKQMCRANGVRPKKGQFTRDPFESRTQDARQNRHR